MEIESELQSLFRILDCLSIYADETVESYLWRNFVFILLCCCVLFFCVMFSFLLFFIPFVLILLFFVLFFAFLFFSFFALILLCLIFCFVRDQILGFSHYITPPFRWARLFSEKSAVLSSVKLFWLSYETFLL